jgi:hypothetical protein
MRRLKEKPCIDHEGNMFPSIKDMCGHYGIKPETYTRRMNVYGMTKEEALTKPIKPNGGRGCTDHLGNRYPSMNKMCARYGLERSLFKYRMNAGWTLEDALTTPSRAIHGNKYTRYNKE